MTRDFLVLIASTRTHVLLNKLCSKINSDIIWNISKITVIFYRTINNFNYCFDTVYKTSFILVGLKSKHIPDQLTFVNIRNEFQNFIAYLLKFLSNIVRHFQKH